MVGIIGYGSYIPFYRVKNEEISRVWGRDLESIKKGLLIEEKSIPGNDEDTLTMGTEASLNALKRAMIDPKDIGAIYCGTETSAYAVKPNMITIAEAIGATPNLTGADLEFACKAGTAAIQVCMGMVKSGMINYGLAIGTDIAKYDLKDVADPSAGAGAGAFIIGDKKEEVIAEIEDTLSYSTDTPDFWRRQNMKFGRHSERFTGVNAYFKHTIEASKRLMAKLDAKPDDYDYAVFHSPNGKFVKKVAKIMGFDLEKIQDGFIVNKIANTYSAASLIGLTAILDKAKSGERIFMTSFGSGAGSDSFSIKVTHNIKGRAKLARSTQEYIERKKVVDYALYCKYTDRLE